MFYWNTDTYSIMKKDKKKGIKNFSRRSLLLSFENNPKRFLVSKTNYLRDLLKRNWEIFLLIYQSTKEKMPLVPLKNTSFFYSKQERFFDYNYLIIAKIIDLVGNIPKIKHQIRNLVQKYFQHFELEKFFRMKLFKNNIFLSWISDLLLQEILYFLKKTNLFFYQSRLLFFFKSKLKSKVEFKTNKNLLVFQCSDFLSLKWYQSRINTWLFKILNKKQNTNFVHQLNKSATAISTNNVCNNFDNFLDCLLNNENYGVLNDLDTQKNLSSHHSTDKKHFYNQKLQNRIKDLKKIKQKYILSIKNILKKNKITTQIKVIKKVNKILENWDTLFVNNFSKIKSINFNLPFSQLLLNWGLARHRNQKAKWIKDRYWSFQ